MLVLSEVQRNPETTQRRLASRLGISLGLTNLLLRTLVTKGYIRATQAGWRRWIYALTPAGFSLKIQLVLGYVIRFLDQYQSIRQTLRDELQSLELHSESRVAIYGIGEFAELVYLGLRDFGIEEIDIFVSGNPQSCTFLGMPVRNLTELRQENYDRILVALLGHERNSCPKLLSIGLTREKLVTFFEPKDIGALKEIM